MGDNKSSIGLSTRVAITAVLMAAGAPAALAQFNNTSIITRAQFTDRNGTVLWAGGLLNNYWEYDDSYFDDTDDFLGTQKTNNFGVSQIFTIESELDGALEFYGTLRAQGDWGRVRAWGNAATPAYQITWPSPTNYWSVNHDATGDFNIASPGRTTATGRAFGISQPIDFMYNYYKGARFNATLPEVQVRYDPTNGDNSGAYYTWTADRINLNSGSWSSWDVIMHEYGHHVMDENGMSAHVGGAHTWGRENITARGAKVGSQLGWNEGASTVLGLMAVVDGNIGGRFTNGGRTLGVNDRDNRYHDLGQNFWVNMESFRTSWGNDRGQGEGDEMAVGRALWDMYDNTPGEAYATGGSDKVAFGAKGVWDRFFDGDGAGNQTFRDAWQDISADMGTAAGRAAGGAALGAAVDRDAALAILGEVLTANNIAHDPLTEGFRRSWTPLLEWDIQNNGVSDSLRVIVFSDDFSTIEWDSGLLGAVVGGAARTSIRTGELAGDDYLWVVLNTPAWETGIDLTDRFNLYWSGANAITVIPAPGVLAMLGLGLVSTRRRPSKA